MNCKFLYETIAIQRWLAEERRTKTARRQRVVPLLPVLSKRRLSQRGIMVMRSSGYGLADGQRLLVHILGTGISLVGTGTASRRRMTCSGVTNTGSGDLRTRPEAVGSVHVQGSSRDVTTKASICHYCAFHVELAVRRAHNYGRTCPAS